MTPPTALVDALESGTITEPQIRELIDFQARELGLSFDQAMSMAREGTLPASPLGTNIEFLAELLAA
jgi:hypothetical protein